MKPSDVRQQFAQTAEAYATSDVHARGPDLPLVLEFLRPAPTDLVLDVSTGTGHTALAVAPHVKQVVGVDLTPEMLAVARRMASERGLANIDFQEANVERLPFPDASFDKITCRTAAHHYPDLPRAVGEMARVLRPGGRLVVSDTISPPDSTGDRFINALETLRDPSHVRDWSLDEWRSALDESGLKLEAAEELRLELDFASWVRRSNTPEELQQVLMAMLLHAPQRLQDMFCVRPEPLRLCLHKVVLTATRPPA